MLERDRLLVQDIVEHGKEAMHYLDGVTLVQFRADRRLRLVVERLLEIIGEAGGALSPEARDRVEFDWKAVRGLRNLIAHQYGHVDADVVYSTVKHRVPKLIAALGVSVR